ncbi:MAG: PIG-L family deacetylase [Sulfuricellaceae bacterium]
MKKIVIVVAPHPDDETFGCGGTLLRHTAEGDEVHWLIVTDMRTEHGFSQEAVNRRQAEIQKVAASYIFSKVHNLELPPARLDTLAKGNLVDAIGRVIKEISPTVVYLPFRGDIHTDHAAVFDAVVSCTKWFRYPSIRRALCYETLSETDFGLNPEGAKFVPNSFVDITPYINQKIEIARLYESEMGEFPFPRSAEALRALAQVRGAACGCLAAESFMLLREIIK